MAELIQSFINALQKLEGEYCDITVPTYNNKFGKAKIFISLRHGTAIPIAKFVEEYGLIDSNTTDDKSEKRVIRFIF